MVSKQVLGYLKFQPVLLVENIWRLYPTVEGFIEMFTFVDTHETLHKVLLEVMRE